MNRTPIPIHIACRSVCVCLSALSYLPPILSRLVSPFLPTNIVRRMIIALLGSPDYLPNGGPRRGGLNCICPIHPFYLMLSNTLFLYLSLALYFSFTSRSFIRGLKEDSLRRVSLKSCTTCHEIGLCLLLIPLNVCTWLTN